MKYLTQKILAVVVLMVSIAGMFGANYAYAVSVQPKVQAFYQDSLATKVVPADTSMTLVRGTDTQGRTISGLYGFVIDEGTASQETVICTASGTSETGCTRGVDVGSGTTTVSANIKTHARGASVKITTWPSLGIINNQLAGVEALPSPIFYDSGVSTTTDALNRQNVASVGLVQDTAFSGAGIINASATNKGSVQLATGAQAAASTGTGSSGALLVLPSSIATSTYNSATAANVVVITGGTGKIDNSFIATTTLFNNSNLLGTTTVAATSSLKVGSFSAWEIGKQYQIFSSTGTSTFSAPAGVQHVFVEVQGGGNDGGGASTSGHSGSGGGAGGYCAKMVDLTGTSTVQVHVGGGGDWSTFGTNGFYCRGNGGTAGTDAASSHQGGAGGTASGGDINIAGQDGEIAGSAAIPGTGGNSKFGFGGSANTAGSASGFNGTGYGSGGGGASSSGSSNSGGGGAQGIVIIRW